MGYRSSVSGAPEAVAVVRTTGFPVKRPLERLLFETATVAAGTFRCTPEDAHFVDTGPASTHCFVFPRTHVWIRHAGSAPFLANPAVATLYNQGQVYERRKLSPQGDRSDWFAVAPAVVEDVVASVGGSFARSSERLFNASHVPTGAATYLLQRQLVERLSRGEAVAAIEVEETAITLLETLLRRAETCGAPRERATTACRQRNLVDDAKLLLTLWLERHVELADLARHLGCSVFHLCRTFRRIEGTTIHEYQSQLRLRASLERLADMPDSNITGVALDLGFCSHSHFTNAFRRTFDITPSAFIRRLRTGPASPATGA